MDKKPGLSPRQLEIMQLAAQGMTDKEIAQVTGLSVGTLRSHWDRMRARLGASSRSEVIARACDEALRVVRDELKVLRVALTQCHTLVWTATPDGHVDYVNDWFTEFSGLPPENLLGASAGCVALMTEEDLPAGRERWWQAQARAAGYRARVLFRSASGALVPHQIEIAPLEVEEGRVLRWVGTACEVT